MRVSCQRKGGKQRNEGYFHQQNDVTQAAIFFPSSTSSAVTRLSRFAASFSKLRSLPFFLDSLICPLHPSPFPATLLEAPAFQRRTPLSSLTYTCRRRVLFRTSWRIHDTRVSTRLHDGRACAKKENAMLPTNETLPAAIQPKTDAPSAIESRDLRHWPILENSSVSIGFTDFWGSFERGVSNGTPMEVNVCVRAWGSRFVQKFRRNNNVLMCVELK